MTEMNFGQRAGAERGRGAPQFISRTQGVQAQRAVCTLFGILDYSSSHRD
jgi:hypothetical protein